MGDGLLIGRVVGWWGDGVVGWSEWWRRLGDGVGGWSGGVVFWEMG